MRIHAFAVMSGFTLASFCAVATLPLACGGSSSSDVTAASTDAGNDSSTSSEASSDKPYTLDDVCDRTAPILCETRKACCTASGTGYDEAGCLAHARAECAKDVADVRAGKATFHGDRIPACITKIKALLAESCVLTFDLLQKYIRDIAACQTFEGSLDVGATCERGSQCKAGATKDELAGCDDDTKKCKTTKVVGENAPCSLTDGLTAICDQGLYCDIDFGDAGKLDGVCRKKTPLKSACDKNKKPVSLECGLGNYCDKATALCTAGKKGGETCEDNFECGSVTCQKATVNAPMGTCKPEGSLAKPEECKGP